MPPYMETIIEIWETCLKYKNPEHCEDNVYDLADEIMTIIAPHKEEWFNGK